MQRGIAPAVLRPDIGPVVQQHLHDGDRVPPRRRAQRRDAFAVVAPTSAPRAASTAAAEPLWPAAAQWSGVAVVASAASGSAPPSSRSATTPQASAAAAMCSAVAPVRRNRLNWPWPQKFSVLSSRGSRASPSVRSRGSTGAAAARSARAIASQSRAAAYCRSVQPLPSTADADNSRPRWTASSTGDVIDGRRAGLVGAGSGPAFLFLLLMGSPPVLVRICAVSLADWMAPRKEKVVVMDFVSALRRIAEVIELEKASGGAVERLRPTAGEELRVTAKPGGLSPPPTSSGQLEEPRPDPPHREAARRGPRGEAGEPAGGVSVEGGRIEGAVRRRDERRGAALIAGACARERLRAVRDGAGGRDAGQLRAARLPSDVSRCDVQVPQVTAGSTALVAEFLAATVADVVKRHPELTPRRHRKLTPRRNGVCC